MPTRTFFIQKYCDRCRKELGENRRLVFSTGEVLCVDCSGNAEKGQKRKGKQDQDEKTHIHQKVELELLREEAEAKK